MARRLAGREPVAYVIALLSWTVFNLMPIPAGLILKAVLDRVAAGPTEPVAGLLVALAVVEVGRWAVFGFAVVQWHGCWVFWNTLPRINLLRSLVHDPGPVVGRLPSSSGEAVSRFRDDSMHLSMVLDVWLDMTGAAVAAASAVAVMAAVDVRVTLVVVVPVMIALGLCRLLGNRLRAWRRREREATAAVTGFIGDLFGAIGAVKVAGAEAAVARRFEELGETRAAAARVDQVATQVLRASSTAIGNVGTGLVVLLVVPALARGDATVGDVGLFAAAVSVLANLPRWAASTGAYHRQADVSVERMARLLPDRAPMGVVEGRRWSCGTARARSAPRPSRRPTIASARTPCASSPSAGSPPPTPVAAASTTSTSPFGAAPSPRSRARSAPGSPPCSAACSAWHRSTTASCGGTANRSMTRRRCSCRPAPHTWRRSRASSASRCRTLSSSASSADGLHDAVRLACLDEDVAWMPEGLATVVGAKGVRLSGGQIQRTAAARAFVRRPELLVIDDISSALDVDTEARMWAQLLDTGDVSTVLVVSHRPAVLERADQVIELLDGRRVT